MAELLMNSAYQAKDQCGRVGPGYVTAIMRTKSGISKEVSIIGMPYNDYGWLLPPALQ